MVDPKEYAAEEPQETTEATNDKQDANLVEGPAVDPELQAQRDRANYVGLAAQSLPNGTASSVALFERCEAIMKYVKTGEIS